MNTHNLTGKMPLTLAAHQLAQKFYKKHDQPAKAKQVYLNTLAVSAVNAYLNCLGVETELEESDSYNFLCQILADCADLNVKGFGKLECRPVLPNEDVCYVPPEAWEDRQGYLAVQLDHELKEAQILGFLPRVDTETISLKNWQSLERLLEQISQSNLAKN